MGSDILINGKKILVYRFPYKCMGRMLPISRVPDLRPYQAQPYHTAVGIPTALPQHEQLLNSYYMMTDLSETELTAGP